MKRWILVLVAIFVVLGGIVTIMVRHKVDMTFATRGEAVFKYGDKNISQTIFDDDFTKICDLFNGKKLYSDNLSCGFSNDISIKINETEQLCLAQDSCPIVYWKNKNKFFKLSNIEYDALTKILDKYGFVFPCL